MLSGPRPDASARFVNCQQPVDTFQGLVVSLVLSRLDYEDATSAGIPAYLLSQLQVVINAGNRLLSNVDRRKHVTPLLLQLHWLHVPDRITFKMATLMFQCVNGTAFGYGTPIIRRETCCRFTWSKTLTLSSIFLNSHPNYATFFNWRPRLRRRGRLCLEQTSPGQQICHTTICFSTPAENLSV